MNFDERQDFPVGRKGSWVSRVLTTRNLLSLARSVGGFPKDIARPAAKRDPPAIRCPHWKNLIERLKRQAKWCAAGNVESPYVVVDRKYPGSDLPAIGRQGKFRRITTTIRDGLNVPFTVDDDQKIAPPDRRGMFVDQRSVFRNGI